MVRPTQAPPGIRARRIRAASRRSSRHALTTGDLFAGAGGLSVGFGLAGFKSLFFNEIDRQAAETFQVNFPDASPFVCPIEELNAADLQRRFEGMGSSLDVMIGGPPCQGFSINAPERSEKDPRNHLFRHYVRLVLEGIRPKFVLLENVPGLLSLDQGDTLAQVQAAFERAGYRAIVKILNAAHYGVPQERWRLIMLGTRLQGVELSFPEPRHYSHRRPNFSGGRTFTFREAVRSGGQLEFFGGPRLKPAVTVQEAIGDLPSIPSGGGALRMAYEGAASSPYQREARRGSRTLHNHLCSGLAAVNLDRMKHIRPGGSWRDIPEAMLPRGMTLARRSDHTRRYGRLDPEGLSGTIMTKCDPHWGTFFHYDQDRVVSVREAARLQSFPDGFRFTGALADQYRQVGNAVPPLLARAIAEHIREILIVAEAD